jgi:hypothetical protein
MKAVKIIRKKKRTVPPDRKAAMTRALRAATAKALQGYRSASGADPEAVARSLGWPWAAYLDLEAGKASPSRGQQEDIRRLLRGAIAKSAPAEVHYRSFRHQVEDEGRADLLSTAECGLYTPGDRVTGYKHPRQVTCMKCRLTPAWIDAMRIYAGEGGAHLE